MSRPRRPASSRPQPPRPGHTPPPEGTEAVTAATRAMDLVFTLLVGILYCYAVSSACLAGTYLEYSQGALFFWSAVFTTGFYLVFFNKYTTTVCLTTLLLATLGVYIYLYRVEFRVEWFVRLSEYLLELLDFAASSLPVQEGYSQVIGRGVALIYALITALNLLASFNLLVLTLVGLGTVVYPIYMDWGVSPFATVLFIFCIVVLLAKKLNLAASGYRRRERRRNAAYSLVMLPLCALIVGVAYLLPKPAEAPGGRGVQDFFFRSTNRLVATVTGDSIMSYTADSELGGPVSMSNLFVMEVTSQGRLYLTGVVRDQYTGRAWSRQDGRLQDLGADAVIDTVSYTDWELQQQRERMLALGLVEQTVTVRTGDVETDTLFAPAFHTELRLEEPRQVYMDSNGVLSTRDPLPGGSVYTQSYIPWDWSDAGMLNMLRSANPRQVAGDPEFAAYLQLPDSLPDRVYQLTYELAADGDNALDQLRAIQSHLREMPYTLLTGQVPDGEDFVDYFLFEEQKGYCVYYATAFAVMGRCLDIPTRYVEGFALADNADENGVYTVTNAQAHAWVEAYFPGIGWVPFEPTPPGFTSGEPVVGNNENLDGQTPLPVEDEEEPPDLQEPDESQPETPEPDRDRTPSPEDESTGPTDEEAAKSALSPWLFVVLVLLLAGGGVTLRVMSLRRRFQRERDRTRSERDAVLSYGSGILDVAQRLRVQPQAGETLLVFARRVEGEPPFTDELSGVVEVAEIFGKAAFSVEEVTPREVETVERFHQGMLDRLRGTVQGKVHYLIQHYLLGRF